MFDFAAVLSEWPLLLVGVGWTLMLTALATAGGLALGVACAWVRAETPGEAAVRAGLPAWRRGLHRLGAGVVAGYVELMRNTPFIVQLFFIFFGLPGLGVRLSPEMASVLAMVLNLGGYSAEIVRAGLEATPRGQLEAGRSLALSEAQLFLRVVLPPALGRVWPALVSQIVIVMLGSAVCGQIATQELSYAANLIHSRNFRAFEASIIATLIYLALSMLVRQALVWAGPRLVFGHVASSGR
ncbi:MAG: hypothetical protein RL722_999 [Pseudomonadota bacterium]|jgi:polar amino acid transport system permease protein